MDRAERLNEETLEIGLMDYSALFKSIGVSGFIDIALVTILIYTLLVWLHRTKRAALVLLGILIVGGVYLLAQFFSLPLTSTVLRGFFAVFLIALVVMFQEELRFFFEQIANWSLSRRRLLKKTSAQSMPDPTVKTLSKSVFDLARDRIGALVVLKGTDSLLRHLDGGVDLRGELSEPLIKSIFDPHSIGHDGAMVVEKNMVTRFGCHLPLSKDHQKIGRGGTRHAAALGLSEVSDALCLVVSEERGTVSTVRLGELKAVDDEASLVARLKEFRSEVSPDSPPRPVRDFLLRNGWQKLAAIGIAVVLWLVLVHGAEPVYRRFALPVGFEQVPKGLTIAEVAPKEVEVEFRGPRRAFYMLNTGHLRLTILADHLVPGRTTLDVRGTDLTIPEGLTFEDSAPRQVTILVEETRP